MAGKPSIKRGPASAYAATSETIMEFNSGEPGGPGGLISLLRKDDGKLLVSLYRLDDGVEVVPDHAVNALADTLISWWRQLTPEERSLTGVEYDAAAEV